MRSPRSFVWRRGARQKFYRNSVHRRLSSTGAVFVALRNRRDGEASGIHRGLGRSDAGDNLSGIEIQ